MHLLIFSIRKGGIMYIPKKVISVILFILICSLSISLHIPHTCHLPFNYTRKSSTSSSACGQSTFHFPPHALPLHHQRKPSTNSIFDNFIAKIYVATRGALSSFIDLSTLHLPHDAPNKHMNLTYSCKVHVQ